MEPRTSDLRVRCLPTALRGTVPWMLNSSEKGQYSFRKEIAPSGANFSKGANSFLLNLTPTEKGGKNGRVASSEGTPDPKNV